MAEHQRTKVSRACLICGDTFLARPDRIARGHGLYCSPACARRKPRVKLRQEEDCPVCRKAFLIKPSEVRRGGGKHCSRECYRQSQKFPIDRQFLDRLDTETSHETDCILWVGNQNANGYGLLSCRTKEVKRQILAHRYAFEMAHGRIPDCMHVLHRCDTPRCVNPLHLFLGTPADNAADKVSKGRQQRGETLHFAKLTAEQVRSIRIRYAAGGVTQKQLAVDHDISPIHVNGIIKRRSWKHVE